MKHNFCSKYAVCHVFKALKPVLLLTMCIKENGGFSIHCKGRNTARVTRLTRKIRVGKNVNDNNTPKVGRRAWQGTSERSESCCCLVWSPHQAQISESRLAHSSQPWAGPTMREPEVVKFSRSRNEPLTLLETRENNRSLRQLPLLNVNCFLIKCRQNQKNSSPVPPWRLINKQQGAHTFWGAFLGFSCPLQPYAGACRPFLAYPNPYFQWGYSCENATH